MITVDTVEKAYIEDAAYDMEMAGFYPSALHVSSAELVQSIKIISDHPGCPAIELKPKRIEDLIANRIGEIDSLIKSLDHLANITDSMTLDMGSLEPFIARWHLSFTQRHRLLRILNRWALLANGKDPISAISLDCRNSNQMIKELENALLAQPLDLHETQSHNDSSRASYLR